MNSGFRIAAAAILAASLVGTYANASDPKPPVKKHTAAKKAKTPPPPTVQEQIEKLRTELEGQIDGLKTNLAEKDAQLQKAQQAAADAQAAADKAQAAASAQQQAVTENAAAVNTLQATVTDLKGSTVSLATTVSDETAKIKKDIANPTTLHYKGINLTPGGFVAAETVWRSKATGGDLPTPFSSLPYEGADAYKLSEFYGSGRQSRITLLAEGKTNWGTLRGYYEADWFGTGVTSNNNQSNSYVMRQRVLYAEAVTNSNWKVEAGQMWSLATEQKKGITAAPSDITTPATIDVNYVPGFVYVRQYGFRVVKAYDKAAFGVSAENPQILYTASVAGNTPYAVLGSTGSGAGLYNNAISGLTATTYVQNYTNEPGTTTYLPVYNTVTANTNVVNYSFNQAPDVIVKAALDPGWGHYEVFGIARFAHQTIYPGVTTDILKYGTSSGIYDVFCPKGATSTTGVACAPIEPNATSAGNYSNSIVLGGGGASLRVPVIANKLTVGAKGMYGSGLGRYGASTLSDLTTNAAGEFSPLHSVSGLATVEFNPNPRLMIYLNYGGDYVGRDDWANSSATTLGGPTAYFCPTGTTPATASTACTKSPSAALLAGGGTWGGHWGAPSASALGYGSRVLSNSSCNTLANPGYNGSSTGYYPGGSCGAQTRDVQEVTGGYWYDIYKGDKGRLRQAIQYGYAVREGWSGASGIGAKGIDNMFWTSFRYYLP